MTREDLKGFEQFIALIDFDLCVCQSDYPELGPMYQYADAVINKWREQGIYIAMNTCRTGRAELEAEVWLLKHKINFHKMNDHHPSGLLHYGTQAQIDHNMNSRKLWGHVNIDDTNIRWKLEGHPGWRQLDEWMQEIIANMGENKYNLKPNYDYSYVEQPII